MSGDHWKNLFTQQGWIQSGRLSPAYQGSEEIVVVMRSSEERCFPLKDLIQATDDFLVFQGLYESDEPVEPYKVWLAWGDVLAVWDYRDPLKEALR